MPSFCGFTQVTQRGKHAWVAQNSCICNCLFSNLQLLFIHTLWLYLHLLFLEGTAYIGKCNTDFARNPPPPPPLLLARGLPLIPGPRRCPPDSPMGTEGHPTSA